MDARRLRRELQDQKRDMAQLRQDVAAKRGHLDGLIEAHDDYAGMVRALQELVKCIDQVKQKTPKLSINVVTGPAGEVDWSQSEHPLDGPRQSIVQLQYHVFSLYGMDHYNAGVELEEQVRAAGTPIDEDGDGDEGNGDRVPA